MFLSSDRRLARVLHLALGLLLVVEGAVNLGLCIVNERGMLLIAFHATQVVAALLFIVPRTLAAGACILVGAFLAAAGVHALEHTLPFEHLVYAVAVLMVWTRYKTPVGSERTTA